MYSLLKAEKKTRKRQSKPHVLPTLFSFRHPYTRPAHRTALAVPTYHTHDPRQPCDLGPVI